MKKLPTVLKMAAHFETHDLVTLGVTQYVQEQTHSLPTVFQGEIRNRLTDTLHESLDASHK